MYGTEIVASRWRRAVAVVAVIAIHLLLYGWLHGSGGWQTRRDAPAPSALVTLRLLPWAEAPVPQPSAEPKTKTPQVAPQSAFGPVGAPTPTLPTRERAPPTTATPTTMQADAGASPSPPASAASQPMQPPPPLNLALPPGQGRRIRPYNPALDDPRANTARTTPEQRMAASFDTRVIEEDLGDGRRRIRQGDKCVIVQQSRIGQLMPFNDAAARSPSLVGACP